MKLYLVPRAFLGINTVVDVPCESTKCALSLCLALTMKLLKFITSFLFLEQDSCLSLIKGFHNSGLYSVGILSPPKRGSSLFSKDR